MSEGKEEEGEPDKVNFALTMILGYLSFVLFHSTVLYSTGYVCHDMVRDQEPFLDLVFDNVRVVRTRTRDDLHVYLETDRFAWEPIVLMPLPKGWYRSTFVDYELYEDYEGYKANRLEG